MNIKQLGKKYSTVIALSSLTLALGTSSCNHLFSSIPNASVEVTADKNKDEALQTFNGHSSWVYAIAVSPDGRYLASGSYGKEIKIWDLSSGKFGSASSNDALFSGSSGVS